MVGDEYLTFELLKVNQSVPKSYEDAKSEVLTMYVDQEKRARLLELAKNSFSTFKGKITDFITVNDSNKLTELSESEASEFLNTLVAKESKKAI